MLHAIGRKQRIRGDLVDMLLECHARIRSFSDLAVAVAEHADPPASEVIDACVRIERYFVEALPFHVQDEEDSVLPRLRGHSPLLDAALERMHDQHEIHEALLQRLVASLAGLRGAPTDPAARSAVLAVARPSRSLFTAHLQAEEELVFPALRALPPPDQDLILHEMRARRAP